jgi:hypothetical protein
VRTIEQRIKTCRMGVKSAVVALVSLLFITIVPISRNAVGYKLLLFVFFCDVYMLLLLLWFIRRIKKSSQKEKP